MRLVRLELQTLPGIEPGFVLEDIAPGVNMVIGPNGIGKSSLLRALGYLLLEPVRADPLALVLSARFENGGVWTVRRTGSQQLWECDGRRAEAPPLPPRDQLHCYWLSMEELLRADARDELLVAELRRALSGGYDLKSLRAGSLQVGARFGQIEASHLQEARRGLRQVQSEYAALRKQEARLPELEQEIESARAADRGAGQLRAALELLQVTRERREIEAALATFPACMRLLRGDEPQRLRDLEQAVEKRRIALERLHQQQEDLLAMLVATGLAGERPEERTLKTWRARLDAARRQQDQLEQQRAQLEQARGEVAAARQALGGMVGAPQLTPRDIARAEHLARRLRECEIQCDELRARMDIVPAPDPAGLARQQGAVLALRDWLVAAAPGPRPRWLALALAIGGAVFAAAAGMLMGGWWAVPGAVLAGVAAGWALAGSRDPARAAAQQRYRQAGLAPPVSWERAAVADRLGELEQSLAEMQRLEVRAGEARELEQRLQRSQSGLAELQREKSELAETLGFDPSLTTAALDTFAHRMSDYQRALERQTGLSGTVQRLEADIAQALAGVGEFLHQWQVPAALQLEDLDVALEMLASACRQAESAQRDLDLVQRDLDRVQRELAEQESAIERMYQEIGLAPGQRAELERHCQGLEEWRQRRDQLADARRREDERHRSLAAAPDLLERVEREDGPGLEDALREQQGLASGLEALLAEQAAIRTRLADAGADRKLEQAWAQEDTAQTALRERRDELLQAESGQYLLDAVEQEYRSEHEPAMLSDARERFRRFTHHAWDLALEDDRGFMAREAATGALRALRELSSGTRMQLLLAVRLAWARYQERRTTPLPLFLDEALTSSDETRFGSVARSLEQLAQEEGRQIFYLSARRHELELWQRLTGQRPHLIDLVQVRFGRESTAADYTLPEPQRLPEPGGRSPEAYAAALGVPAVDPHQPVGMLHPFYLLRDDLPLLHRLLELWHVVSLGQLRQLLDSGPAEAVADAPRRRRLQARCAVADAWFDAWRRGRGRPLDRSALEASGAVTGTFIDEVEALAREHDGDGQALVAALRDGVVKGFRQANMDRLETWLREAGYIDPQPRLDAGARCREALQQAVGREPSADVVDLRQVLEGLEAALAQER